jgi:phosphogluconate dehydratase
MKTSAVAPERRVLEAPARVFHSQDELHAAFRAGELFRDVVAAVRFQGPRAIGMPELHKLTPPLGVAQDRGHRVALVTDGRLSGASGKVPAALHVTPEAEGGGPIAKIRDGDRLRLDAPNGRLEVIVEAAEWAARAPATAMRRAGAAGLAVSMSGRRVSDRCGRATGRAALRRDRRKCVSSAEIGRAIRSSWRRSSTPS